MNSNQYHNAVTSITKDILTFRKKKKTFEDPTSDCIFVIIYAKVPITYVFKTIIVRNKYFVENYRVWRPFLNVLLKLMIVFLRTHLLLLYGFRYNDLLKKSSEGSTFYAPETSCHATSIS